jgi:hypothetical protein
MIPVPRVPEPSGFDEKCRQRGRRWLREHSADSGRPPDYWSEFRFALADGFRNRCGYCAMYIPEGTIDHHRPISLDPDLIYEWTNFRYVAGWINSSKKKVSDVVLLDPHDVGDGWFEITLPDLQMRTTSRVPVELRARAEFTLDRLHLRHDERVIRQRRMWMEMFETGGLTLESLEHVAPLLAQAVRRATAAPRADNTVIE